MSGLIAGLAGAPQAASVTQGFYGQALNNDVNAAGSPAAADFAKLQAASLRPQFAAQDAQLGAQSAAQGLVGSGEGRALGGSVASNQASTLAGVTAPLYQQALGNYGQVNAEMPGAETQSYNDAISQFEQAVASGASAFGGGFGGGGGAPAGGATAPPNPYYG